MASAWQCRGAALLLVLAGCAHALPRGVTPVEAVAAPGAVALAVADDWELYREVGATGRRAGLVAALGGPLDLALTRTVLLAERTRVRLFDARLHEWGELGPFAEVGAVAADPAGRLYVADAGAGALFRFLPDGSPDTAFGANGRLGEREGFPLRHPAQLAAAGDGAVAAFDPDAGAGAVCEPGPEPLQYLCHPLAGAPQPGDGGLALLDLGDPGLCRQRRVKVDDCALIHLDASLVPQGVLSGIASTQRLRSLSAGPLLRPGDARFLLLGARPDGGLHAATAGAGLGDLLEAGERTDLGGPLQQVAYDPAATAALAWAQGEAAGGEVVAYAVVGGALRRLVLDPPRPSRRPCCCWLWPTGR